MIKTKGGIEVEEEVLHILQKQKVLPLSCLIKETGASYYRILKILLILQEKGLISAKRLPNRQVLILLKKENGGAGKVKRE